MRGIATVKRIAKTKRIVALTVAARLDHFTLVEVQNLYRNLKVSKGGTWSKLYNLGYYQLPQIGSFSQYLKEWVDEGLLSRVKQEDPKKPYRWRWVYYWND